MQDITVVSGVGAGATFTIDRDDPAMARQHAAVEFSGRLNGTTMQSAELRDGDRFEIGGRRFLLAFEEREREPDPYELKA